MKPNLRCYSYFCNNSLLRCLVVATVFAISATLGQAYVFAQNVSSVYTPPLLKAPYTLVFAVRVKKLGFQLRGDTPLKPNQTGTLTVSTNGNKVLYLAKFGKWSEVIICDLRSDTEYFYENSQYNAVIQPGVNSGLIKMSLLPMPGVGYDFYPMFQSFRYSETGPSRANMAIISAVTAVKSGIIQGMYYQDSLVQIDHKSYSPTVTSCKVLITSRPALAEEVWNFSKYRSVGSVSVAGVINHVLNTSTVTGLWPPNAVKQDGEVGYTLLSASTKPLPDRRYDLANYLPSGCPISDARKNL